MLSEPILTELVGIVQRSLPDVEAVYLFGSKASGAVHPGSDLDLALLLPAGASLDVRRRVDLVVELETAARCRVDLSVLDLGTGVVHAKEVVSTGIPIFVRDPTVLHEFEMSALSRYARLNEDRAPVLEAYRAEAHGRG